MMIQLNPPLPMETPKGKAFAHMVIDYSQEHDLVWVCFDDITGECWLFRNSEVRMQKNLTFGRNQTSAILSKAFIPNGKIG